MTDRRIVLIIGGGIAAYKCLDLIRRLKERGIGVRVVLTRAAEQFVTPLSVGALSNEPVFTNLFDLNAEREIGHIRLSREAELIVVAPATADLLAKMAGGHADDLASTVLMATDKPVLVAPAMNPRMWMHPATQRNVAQLRADGITVIEPAVGEMAERGEAGPGRLPEVPELLAAILAALDRSKARAIPLTASKTGRASGLPAQLLAGRHVLVTSGPTHEPIDPVRYIANRSSGKQGHAIAAAAAAAGARVTLISGPVSLPDPAGVDVVHVETAAQMLEAAQSALPADAGIFTAAVADWRVATPGTQKIKKSVGAKAPKLSLTENPDILKTIAASGPSRPQLIVGFAAETNDVAEYAAGKLKSKNADWIVANDVSPETGIMGGDHNLVHLVTVNGVETWPEMSKSAVAEQLIARIAAHFASRKDAAE
ncbi:MAG: bifunctional phosphopantothenoylcysteine decarboxylase/phosphopantothenate--cysteine ligase CoaBC [Hyphomicrobiaceae bacterium]|nr:bifunctional phosphopantothenoylcysteine decarboxylase/phosphopantothenate--cysteine ligase CoaBC [Hyphomicrobiaceae bacterium]